MGGPEVKAFLEHLAVQRHVAAATQNQPSDALVFSIGMFWEQLSACLAL